MSGERCDRSDAATLSSVVVVVVVSPRDAALARGVVVAIGQRAGVVHVPVGIGPGHALAPLVDAHAHADGDACVCAAAREGEVGCAERGAFARWDGDGDRCGCRGHGCGGAGGERAGSAPGCGRRPRRARGPFVREAHRGERRAGRLGPRGAACRRPGARRRVRARARALALPGPEGRDRRHAPHEPAHHHHVRLFLLLLAAARLARLPRLALRTRARTPVSVQDPVLVHVCAGRRRIGTPTRALRGVHVQIRIRRSLCAVPVRVHDAVVGPVCVRVLARVVVVVVVGGHGRVREEVLGDAGATQARSRPTGSDLSAITGGRLTVGPLAV